MRRAALACVGLALLASRAEAQTSSSTPAATPAYTPPAAPVNVLKYVGLQPPLMDGVENESPILSAIFGAAPAYSRVFVPPGGLNLSYTPAIGPLPKILQMSGNSYGTGSTIISNLEPDVLEETMGPGGDERWYRTDSGTDNAGILALQGVFGGTSSSNTPAGPTPLLGSFCFDPAPTSATSFQNSYVWCNQTYVHDDHIGAAQNVALATTMVRDPFTDGFGVRGPTWAFYWEATDNSGLPSNQGGATVGAEADLFANGEDPGTAGDGGDRDDMHIVLGRAYGRGLPARVGHAITMGTGDFGSATPSYVGRFLDTYLGQWDTAAIDTSGGHPLVTTLATSAAQSGTGTGLQFAPYGAGVEVGMVASGTGIPTGDTVASFNATSGSVTLSAATTTAVASGTSVTFTSLAPAIRIGAGQTIDLSGNSSATMSYSSGAIGTSAPLSPASEQHQVVPITAARSLLATDCGNFLRYAGTAAVTLTVPTGLPACSIDLIQAGTGQIQIAAGSGETAEAYNGATYTAGQGAHAAIIIDSAATFEVHP